MLKILLSALLLTYTQVSSAQNNPQVIRASSKIVDIRDGEHFKRGYWYIMPEKKPDYYFVEIPEKPHSVSFITDLDSISFEVQYGQEYDFIILLNNKDTCYTRIAAKYKKLNSYTSNQSTALTDTIPFSIGDNSKIYLKGSVNNSAPLNIQLDLGAGGCIIKKSSVKKVTMNFDGSITLTNSDGQNQVPYSSVNQLTIGGLKWDSIEFAVAGNMTSREDLIAGNSLFQNKIIEINYDKKMLVIHDSLPKHADKYSKLDIILDGVIPFLRGSLTIPSRVKTGWYMFDTGAYTTILQNSELSSTGKMIIELKKMLGIISKNDTSSSPRLSFGNYSFRNFNYTRSKANRDKNILGLLGNDLLKRFNVMLDNKNGFIYLQTNSLVNEPYSNPEFYLVRILSLTVMGVIGIVTFIMYKKITA